MAKQEADDYQRHVYLPELLAEKESLGPSFVHCARLLDKEIDRVKYGGAPSVPSQVTLSEKIEVPVKDFPGFNFVGRLLGPRGLTMKRMQTETNCKMTIMGRGSIRDANKEEELRNCDDPKYEHLKENLYVFIEARGSQGIAAARLAAGVAEVRKMLIPCEHDQIREEQLRELALLNDLRNHADTQRHPATGAEYQFARPNLPAAGPANGSLTLVDHYSPSAHSAAAVAAVDQSIVYSTARPSHDDYTAPSAGAMHGRATYGSGQSRTVSHHRGRGYAGSTGKANSTNGVRRMQEMPPLAEHSSYAAEYSVLHTAIPQSMHVTRAEYMDDMDSAAAVNIQDRRLSAPSPTYNTSPAPYNASAPRFRPY